MESPADGVDAVSLAIMIVVAAVVILLIVAVTSRIGG